MILAIVDFEVAPTKRAAALAALEPEIQAAQALDGNISYRAFINADSKTHIGILHSWDTLENFQVYGASATFKRIGQILRPLMTVPPVSRRMRAEIMEEVHG